MNQHKVKKAIFLDRDGVLVEDVHLLARFEHIRVLDGVATSLSTLRSLGYLLIVVSNQPIVARGIIEESDVIAIQREVERLISLKNGPRIDAFYYCPHHPEATRPQYRADCECRKPRPGMIQQASDEHCIDLARSIMIGDRITDIIAGQRAGCRSILLQTGRHLDPPIQTSEPINPNITADFVCTGLTEAAAWISKNFRDAL